MAITILTAENFATEVENSEQPVLIDFYASWCGPCKALAPTMESLAVQYGNQFKICKVDVDEQPLLAEKFNIMSVPTLILLHKGNIQQRTSGNRSREDILKILGIN